MTTKSQTLAGSQSGTRIAGQRIATGLFALFLGAFFIFGAGFAHSQALHDTAHDVRHAFGFPCH
ncbi:CbtB-domain containing protein [Aurantimonas sp. 22II-16-19i]|uniref:CbtB domain-containing protein n=1 Tax=Aurantimonas sp. 22II-16-19i TaxID=1317114 RepID=UPI0009F7B6DE|nr:CbtB-domain containing protein [Aurantimonas sp. 22II-16-19i]ORE91653.1 cobalt transporter subunit CbtB [Aurantimonas sp. 22II-16-19i]